MDKQYQDREVVGLDRQGNVVQWHAGEGRPFSSGQKLADWGIQNLREHECERVGVEPEQWRQALAARSDMPVESMGEERKLADAENVKVAAMEKRYAGDLTDKQKEVLDYLAQNGIPDAQFWSATELRVFGRPDCGLRSLTGRAGINWGGGGATGGFAYSQVKPELFSRDRVLPDQGEHEAIVASADQPPANPTSRALAAQYPAKGSMPQAVVHQLYQLREDEVAKLAKQEVVTAGDLSDLDCGARSVVATMLYGKCNDEAKHALLHDEHHFVRSAAVLAQAESEAERDNRNDCAPGM